MSNANAPAYPGEETVFGEGMGGVLANMTGAGISDIADFSVQCADALLARLESDKC